MSDLLSALWKQDHGQDIIEYTLLIAFVTFATAALFLLGAGASLQGIWTSGNNTLQTANTSAVS
jgi:Flp pilus assembly pilin Flp